MRKNAIIFLIIGLVLMPLVLAEEWPVCFDFQAPDAPTNLVASGNVELTWTAPSDPPTNCSSGVDFYIVYRGDNLLGTTSSTTYKDGPLPVGTYTYKVTAVDSLGNGESRAASVIIMVRSSASTESDDDWDCGNWSACISGKQNQRCTHKTLSGVTKTNIQNCIVQTAQQATTKNQSTNQTQNQTRSGTTISPAVQEQQEGTNQTIASEESDVSPTGAVVVATMTKTPWALIILSIGLIGAIIIFVLLMRKPAKHGKEEWAEITALDNNEEVSVPKPPMPATDEKEGEWIELKVPKARAKAKAKRRAAKKKAKKTLKRKR